MDEFARILFKNAVLREQSAHRMYVELAQKAKRNIIRNLFLKLAEEELVHERLFSKMSLSVLKIVNRAPLENLNLLKGIDKIIIGLSIKDIDNALDFAISEEQKAYDDYNMITNYIEFGEARETFQEIARQELRHKTLLQKVKLEFNDNDWNTLKIKSE